MKPEYEAAIAAIDAAVLSATEYRAARRLLDICDTGSGQLWLEAPIAYQVCRVNSWGSLRRTLVQLKTAGLLVYHADRDATSGVTVRFTAWAMCGDHNLNTETNDNACSDCDHRCSESEHEVKVDGVQIVITEAAEVDPCSDSDHPCAESEHRCSESEHEAPLIGCLVVDPIQAVNGKHPTNHASPPSPEPETALQVLSLGLLKAVGVGAARAVAISKKFDFEEVRRQVADWLPGHRAGDHEVGLLIYRIEHSFAVDEIDDEFKRDPLYRKFLTAAEQAEDERRAAATRAALAAEEEAPPPPKRPEPVAADFVHDQPWAELRLEYRNGLAVAALADAGVLEIAEVGENLQYTIGCQPAHVDYLTRMKRNLERSLSQMNRRKVCLEILPLILSEPVPN